MKTIVIALNICTILLLLYALKVSHMLFHTLSTGEGMPPGFPRRYIEGDGLTVLLITGLITSIATLLINIFKNKKKEIY